jgi:hypothetical protein
MCLQYNHNGLIELSRLWEADRRTTGQCTLLILTISLLMYIRVYGASRKARNVNVVYTWTYVWQRWKPSLSICCTMFQHWINSESFPVSQSCVNTFASYQGYPNYRWDLTLSLLMCIYGAPCKAKNFNVVYIWTYVWQRWKPSISKCCTMFQYWINAESFPMSQLCVNTFASYQIHRRMTVQ